MVMSDFGAEVIKVEAPGGEKFRDWPGAIQWNRGKKSVVLDLKTPEGQEKAQKLARLSDVVVESFRPGVTRRLGIDYANLGAKHPELVYASLTGFGAWFTATATNTHKFWMQYTAKVPKYTKGANTQKTSIHKNSSNTQTF